MYPVNDNLYQEATLFDQALAALRQRLRTWLPARAEQRWALAFRGQAALFALLGLGVLLHGLQAGAADASPLVAVMASAGLMATAHFLFNIPRRTARPAAPACARHEPVPAPARAMHRSRLQPQPRPQPRVSPRDFLNELRRAGVNVRIAKALFTAGVRSPEAVRRSSDAALLAIHGV
ncbi:MAG TPA: helix-hairpin-helix domain-containing protein, partial [Thiohalobacter sp.]|nr:helix-hairpin-helix domain-containing protein [Thiohalobacter sp.]